MRNRSRATFRRGNRGFTFVEALLVVAVLAVIISLMLPALSKTRERMRAVTCANQLKQLGVFYGLYSSDNKGFLGGCVNWGLRDCFTSKNPVDNPDNNGYYERSVWGRSTMALGRYGFDRPVTLCPGRTYSGSGRRTTKTGLAVHYDKPFESFHINKGLGDPKPTNTGSYNIHSPRWWGTTMTGRGEAHNYQDYYFFAGFTDYPTLDWANEKQWGVYTGPGYAWPSELQSPTTHLRQKRSPKAVLVMDRSWIQNEPFATYNYNDVGDISSHLGKASKHKGAILLADGGNNLLLDMSVTWTHLVGDTPSFTNGYKGTVFRYGRDYYRNFFVGGNLINP